MENTLHFLGGLLTGVIMFMLIASFKQALDDTPEIPPGAIVLTRADGVRCVGHVAAPPSFVGVPPRLWMCTGEVPWYDSRGTRIPTHTLGELP